jgi:hypothetical protein
MVILAFILALLAFMASANHGHHGHMMHHSNNGGPLVSSFSHQLPGTNSYMSVTRYFNTQNGQQRALLPNSDIQEQPAQAGNGSGQDYFDPWNPRFKVARLELSDEEWHETLEEVFSESGLLGTKFLRQVPNGMVNFNYDIHVCVHMGTQISPEESAYPPSAISYPHNEDKLHTLVLFDAKFSKLLWLIVNIPGAKVHQGQIVTAYAGPSPVPGLAEEQKFIILAMEQNSGQVTPDQWNPYLTETSCQTRDLPANFDIDALRSSLDLSHPVAANFFTQVYDSFVENVNAHCLKTGPITPHPLYK